MPKTTTFHVRLPAALKKTVQAIAERNGVDLATITRLFFTHVAVQGTIPLPWLTENGYSRQTEAKILEVIAKDEIVGTPLKSPEDIRKFIDEI